MSVSLSEQIGAMALVDQLRHREMEIQEHLDLPQRRAEVAERIRTYYQNSGISFDDAQIEEGVHQFFSRRLMFEAPPLGRVQRLLVRLIMARRKLLSWAGAALLTALLSLGSFALMERRQNLMVERNAHQLILDSRSLQNDIALQRQRLEQVRARLKAKPQALVADLAEKIELRLPKALPAPIELPASIDRDNRGPLNARISQAQAELNAARENVTSATRRLNRVDSVYASLDYQQQVLTRLDAMPLSAADRKLLLAWNTEASNDIAALRLKKANATLNVLKDYLDYAARPLSIELVDRPGVKSGVERCYEAAGCSKNSTRGKSWYLVVEPLDATSKPARMPVTSVETGQTQWADLFAVRVSREEYLKVRQDKLDDGHISERMMGSKPANSLMPLFNQRTSSIPDMILEW
ncbi:hypothetical protein HU720_21280 [Pseudomonas sp. SWRI51]|uniref:DUF6384 family protein n=1 Tax=Pseudomonas sp. SWRI51 TaxID=2745491 RepID=UPI00164811C7|nr:DUF6384 family protein [Pseudomonas sp. SWRI51]MBC3413831.1 hypothetical protein [Pseudomonas sp. SWRI51]